MKTLAKIILASSLMTLAACSGKGSGESRIHNIPSDEDETPIPQVIDDEDETPSEDPSKEDGPKSNIVACKDQSGAYCAETTDLSLKSRCNAANGGQLVDKCPSGGTKCDFGVDGMSFYVYNELVDCSTLEMLETEDWE